MLQSAASLFTLLVTNPYNWVLGMMARSEISYRIVSWVEGRGIFSFVDSLPIGIVLLKLSLDSLLQCYVSLLIYLLILNNRIGRNPSETLF